MNWKVPDTNYWIVPATVVRVIDGDTILVDADLGWRVHLEMAVRVDGINAPESNTAAGKRAKTYAQTIMKPGYGVTVVSKRLLGSTEKYGRTLADLFVSGDSFAKRMLDSGHAKPWDGKGKPPI